MKNHGVNQLNLELRLILSQYISFIKLSSKSNLLDNNIFGEKLASIIISIFTDGKVENLNAKITNYPNYDFSIKMENETLLIQVTSDQTNKKIKNLFDKGDFNENKKNIIFYLTEKPNFGKRTKNDSIKQIKKTECTIFKDLDFINTIIKDDNNNCIALVDIFDFINRLTTQTDLKKLMDLKRIINEYGYFLSGYKQSLEFIDIQKNYILNKFNILVDENRKINKEDFYWIQYTQVYPFLSISDKQSKSIFKESKKESIKESIKEFIPKYNDLIINNIIIIIDPLICNYINYNLVFFKDSSIDYNVMCMTRKIYTENVNNLRYIFREEIYKYNLLILNPFDTLSPEDEIIDFNKIKLEFNFDK